MCCNRGRQKSHLVIVWLTLICYIVALILAIVQLTGMPAIPPGWYIASGVFCVIGICICSLDIYGTQEKNIWYIVPFLVWMILTTIIMGVLAVAYVISYIQVKRDVHRFELDDECFYETYNILGTVIGISVSFFILFAYFCYEISSHIKEVKAQEVLPMRQRDVRSQPRRENTVKH